jgi:hypothetical protein
VRLDEVQGGRLATAADDPALVPPMVGVGAEYSLNSVLAGEVLGATAVPGRDSDEPMAGDAGGPDDGEVRDPGSTKYTESDRGRDHCARHEDCISIYAPASKRVGGRSPSAPVRCT